MADPQAAAPVASYAEARRIVDKRDCAFYGHNWQLVMVTGSPYPLSLHCSRDCGAPVLSVEQPKAGSVE